MLRLWKPDGVLRGNDEINWMAVGLLLLPSLSIHCQCRYSLCDTLHKAFTISCSARDK